MATAFDIRGASVEGLNQFRRFYLSMSHGKLSGEDKIHEMAGLLDGNCMVTYFWGKSSNKEQWIEDTKEMVKGCPKDPNARVDEGEAKVVFESQSHCMVQAKDVWHMGKMVLACVASALFVRSESSPLGVSMLLYQETKDDSQSSGLEEIAVITKAEQAATA